MIEIRNIDQLKDLCNKTNNNICNSAFQNINFKDHEHLLNNKKIVKCIFLGCSMSDTLNDLLIKSGNLIFPKMDVPFETYPSCLYTKNTIYNDFNPAHIESYNNTRDKIIYNHYVKTGKNSQSDIYETLARRLHDHGITNAIMDIIDKVDEKKVVAIMGGHELSRSSDDYKNICKIAKTLSESGFFLLSGGGPGAMEATHIGAWFNGYSITHMYEAIDILSKAPMYNDEFWLAKAFEVIEKYPRKTHKNYDIGIPTWFYGHEPPTPFASKIAKYFENSVREEGLLALAKGGIIYTPGNAGTIQEIFQDFTQNYYNTYGIVSPMIFYNSKFWTEEKPVYPLIKKIASEQKCNNLITISDNEEEIIKLLIDFSSN